MKKTRNGASRTNARALIFGMILTAILIFGGAAICAIILSRTENPSSGIGVCAPTLLYLTAAISSFITAKYKGEGGALPAALASVLSAIIMLIVGLALTKGQLPLIGAVNFAAYAVIGTVTAILAKPKKRFRNGRK